MPEVVEISDLPARTCQRDYVDDFFKACDAGQEYRIGGRLVIGAAYGHCADYPRGFTVTFG